MDLYAVPVLPEEITADSSVSEEEGGIYPSNHQEKNIYIAFTLHIFLFLN